MSALGQARREKKNPHVIDVAETTGLGLLSVMQTSCPVDSGVCDTRVELFCGSCMFQRELFVIRYAGDIPIDPPAEIEQNSNNPSKAGQSSPVKPAVSVCFSTSGLTERQLTSYASTRHCLDRLRGNLLQKVYVLIRVKPRHLSLGRPLCPIYLHRLAPGSGQLFASCPLAIHISSVRLDNRIVDCPRTVVRDGLVNVVAEVVVDDEVVGHANPVRFHGMTEVVAVVSDIWVVKIRYSAGVRGCIGCGGEWDGDAGHDEDGMYRSR